MILNNTLDKNDYPIFPYEYSHSLQEYATIISFLKTMGPVSILEIAPGEKTFIKSADLFEYSNYTYACMSVSYPEYLLYDEYEHYLGYFVDLNKIYKEYDVVISSEYHRLPDRLSNPLSSSDKQIKLTIADMISKAKKYVILSEHASKYEGLVKEMNLNYKILNNEDSRFSCILIEV